MCMENIIMCLQLLAVFLSPRVPTITWISTCQIIFPLYRFLLNWPVYFLYNLQLLSQKLLLETFGNCHVISSVYTANHL